MVTELLNPIVFYASCNLIQHDSHTQLHYSFFNASIGGTKLSGKKQKLLMECVEFRSIENKLETIFLYLVWQKSGMKENANLSNNKFVLIYICALYSNRLYRCEKKKSGKKISEKNM